MKKLYFRLVLFTQLLMCLGIYLIGNGSYYLQRGAELFEDFILYPELHEKIFPWYETFLALPVYFVISLLWALVFTFIAVLVYKLLKKPLPHESWKVVPYPQKVVIVEIAYVLLVYLFIILRKSAIDDISCYIALLKPFSVFIPGIIASVMVALIWQLGQWVQKKTRIAGLLLTVFAPLALVGYLTFYFFSINSEILDCMEEDNQRYASLTGDSDIVSDDGEYEDYEEYDEPEDIGEWEGPIEEDEYMEDCFRFIFIEKNYTWKSDVIALENPMLLNRVTDKNNEIKEAPDPRWLFANNLLLYINRDNNRLLQFYNRFSDIIYKHIPWKKYNSIDGRSQVKLLLRTYEDCSDEYELSDELMIEMFNAMRSHNLNNDSELFNMLTGILNRHGINRYNMEKEIFGEFEIVWGYSFWARRYHENNHNAVFEILNNIDNHYSNIETQLDINVESDEE